MVLLIYADKMDWAARRLYQQIDFYTAERPVERIHSIEHLESWCRRHYTGRGATVAVLFAADRQELAKLYSTRYLLEGFRIILVLPDANPETVSAGHRLRPRYVSYIDGGFEDVVAVLKKMMAKPSNIMETGNQEVTYDARN